MRCLRMPLLPLFVLSILALLSVPVLAPTGESAPAQPEEEIAVRTDGLVNNETPYKVDAIVFEIGPDEGIEYKYRLEENQSMVFFWQASGDVRSEMHSEEDEAEEGTAEFFEVVESTTYGHGTYTAPFPGIHGWYWKNLSLEETVTLKVVSAGFYSTAIGYGPLGFPEFYDPSDVPLPPAP